MDVRIGGFSLVRDEVSSEHMTDKCADQQRAHDRQTSVMTSSEHMTDRQCADQL